MYRTDDLTNIVGPARITAIANLMKNDYLCAEFYIAAIYE